MEEKEPDFVKKSKVIADDNYKKWLGELKQRLQRSQIKAAVKVNTVMLEFYWGLGRDIVALKAEQTWGSGLVEQLSLDLKEAYPNQKGFSARNIWNAKRWYLFYNQDITILHQVGAEFLHQVGGEMPENFGYVPWRHHVEIITKCETVKEALFYIQKTIEGNWSRSYLMDMLRQQLYRKTGTALTNFDDCLPVPQSQLAKEILKDPYNFDFLTLTENYQERELEDALAHNISRFLLELGTGFAYVGRQMELRMPGGQSFFPDMVFYHTKLKCYVVVELKVVDFIPEFAGKLNFYVSAADHLLRDENDNPSIGLLICKAKDKTVVEWSFQDIHKPIGVTSYDLQEVLDKTLAGQLPSIEEIERVIE